jgi:catechol 2,3-dioxygenase-like lactoylglutathione lyase family enzyme
MGSQASDPELPCYSRQAPSKEKKGGNMLAGSHINGFFPTKDSKKAREFYEGVLGLTFVSENEYVVTFRSGDEQIIGQKGTKFEPLHRTILGWEVKDIEKVVSYLRDRGVVFMKVPGLPQDNLGIWKSPEGKVAWFNDPDGNTLSVSEH